jgi:hypothetical protein
LVSKYDKENKFGVSDAAEVAQLNQWLFFQASGQGEFIWTLLVVTKIRADKEFIRTILWVSTTASTLRDA